MDCPEEAKTIDEFEKWPEIGSRAGAVKSCVSLLSAVCGQPAEIMERWLDLYYQVRHAQEKADAAARAAEMYGISPDKDRFVEDSLKASAERITKRLREELKIPEIAGPMRASASTVKDEAANAEPEPTPEKEAEKADTSQEAAPETPVKRPGGKGTPRPSQVGNTRSRDAAVFKRQVRDRLEAVRKKGVSAPEIVKAAPAGSAKESDIYMILQGHVIKIDIYRALDEALRHFEN